jgi:hypothetical protein
LRTDHVPTDVGRPETLGRRFDSTVVLKLRGVMFRWAFIFALVTSHSGDDGATVSFVVLG